MSPDLMYRRRVNTIFGQSEVGKSWFGIYHCLKAVRSSPTACAVYLDYEDDATGMVTRLKAIGASVEEVRRILYIQARSPLSDDLVDAVVKGKIEPFMERNACDECVVIVVDSVDALISSAGGSSNSTNDARNVLQPLKKLAEDTGASVLTIDHESEKGTGRSATQMGSSAKKQIVDGVMLRADKDTPWRPGRAECSTDIVIGKDRHGLVRAQADDSEDMPRVARLVMRVDPERNWASVLTLEPPRVGGGPIDQLRECIMNSLVSGGKFVSPLIKEVHLVMEKLHTRAKIEEEIGKMVEEGLISSSEKVIGRSKGQFVEVVGA